MDYSSISESYPEIRATRLHAAITRGHLSLRDAATFLLLEDAMNEGASGAERLRSFHASDEEYVPLLGKVLRALVAAGEPHAAEKHRLFVEGERSMAPPVFLAPSDVTLASMDRAVGSFRDVAAAYLPREAAADSL